MSELEKVKLNVINSLHTLCDRCREKVIHVCPISKVTGEIQEIKGVPVVVNSRLWHVIFN